MNSSIKKNTYFVSLAKFSHMLLAFILIPFATRYLGPEGFGIYALATTIMYFVLLFNDLGINTYVTREVAKDFDSAGTYYSNSFLLKLSFIVINFILLFLFVEILNFSDEARSAILIFAIYGVLTSIVELNVGIFRAHERMGFESLVLILEKVLTTGAGIFVLLKGWGLFALAWVFVAGGLTSILVSTILVRKYFCELKLTFNIDFEFMKELIVKSLPFGISMFLANIYNGIGIVFLSKMQPAEVVGWFSAAGRILKFTSIVPTILAIAIFPALSREAIKSKEKFAELFTKGFKYISYLAIPLIAGIIILSEDIAMILFGEDFFNSINVLRILAWTAGLIFFNIFLSALFNAANYQKTLVKIQIFAMVVNIILNLVLIPRYAHIGCAMAMVATEVMIFLTCIIFVYHRISRLQESTFLLKVLGATCVMSIVTLYLKSFNLFVAVILSVMIYFSVLYFFKGFLIEEVLILKKR